VNTELGPDATGIGWVFQYALIDTTHRYNLAELRSLQDWFLRYQLRAIPGVAEVAPIGGFVRQYQVAVDPQKLQAYNVPIMRVVEAVRAGNSDVGGRLIESGGAEYMVRGRGYAQNTDDIGRIVLSNHSGRHAGPRAGRRRSDARARSAARRRGLERRRRCGVRHRGDAAGRERAEGDRGRKGEAARTRARAAAGREGRHGVRPVGADSASIDNLKNTIIEEVIVVSVIILIFLWHIPSAIIPVFTIPIAIIISFIPMKMMGLTSNIMSLGGIAIAIGAMVDASIVVVEQTHKKLEEWDREGRQRDYHRVVIDAVKEVGGPSFFALLVIAVSFLPVLTLEAQEGRLFKPLAYTKNFAMIVAAVLAITLDPGDAPAVHACAQLQLPAALAGAR
jgi:copper/silver efflux system protein